MPRKVHPDDDRVYACPECDHAGTLYERVGRGNASVGDTDATFLCEECGHTFNECVERERHPPNGGRGQARKDALEAPSDD